MDEKPRAEVEFVRGALLALLAWLGFWIILYAIFLALEPPEMPAEDAATSVLAFWGIAVWLLEQERLIHRKQRARARGWFTGSVFSLFWLFGLCSSRILSY